MSLTLSARPFVRVLLIAFVGISASSLLAATIHVTPDGNDGNPGSAEQPVATLPKALELIAGKQEPCEIILHKGVYPGDIQIGQQKDPLPLLITAAKNAAGG